ncbi:porin [Cupriavidus taiwanensis]|uniref:porin n=1 Tax=Cupriavidus taiwanensis TaxID=164546 RepID=UPI0015724307|nr:porin [Cupriavidus taiwanensis]NSX14720.1 porin [Cupriavidus taiwanensis]
MAFRSNTLAMALRHLSFGIALTAATASTHAQGSVTIGGLLDEGIALYRDNGGHSQVRMQDSAIFPSKFYLRGTEDLGAGLLASFSLDTMVSLSQGSLDPQSRGALFENSAWVGLRKVGIGGIRLGQQNDFAFDHFLIGGIDPATGIAGGMLNFRTGSFGADLLGLSSPAQIAGGIAGSPYAPITDDSGVPTGMSAINWDRVGGKRMSNAIKLTSDEIAGFSAGLMYSFGEVAGAFPNNSGKSAAIGYHNGDTRAAVVYTEQNYGAVQGGRSGIANLLAGARTSFRGFDLSGMYSQARNTFTGARIYALAAGLGYALTPDLILGAAYTYQNGNAQLKNVMIHQGALQLTYTFSKRTAVYLVGVYQRTNGAYAAEIGNILARGKIQSVAQVGMMHRF